MPRSVQRLKRDDVVYRSISDMGVVSPILMTTRLADTSQDLARLCWVARQETCQTGNDSRAAGTPPG